MNHDCDLISLLFLPVRMTEMNTKGIIKIKPEKNQEFKLNKQKLKQTTKDSANKAKKMLETIREN